MSSICSIEQGATLAAERFPSTAWDNASERDKSKALARASKLIRNLSFSDAYSEELDNVVAACFELAYALLDGADPEEEIKAVYQSVNAFDVLRIGKNDTVHPRILHGIVSQQAWIYLQPYLIDPRTIKLSRI